MLHHPPRSTLFPYTTLFRSLYSKHDFTLAQESRSRQRTRERNPSMCARRGFIIYSKSISVRREPQRSEEHTSELQSLRHLVCRLLLEKKIPPPFRSVFFYPYLTFPSSCPSFYSCFIIHRDLHSFPTRRSSDLCTLNTTSLLLRNRVLGKEHAKEIRRCVPVEASSSIRNRSQSAANHRDRKSTRLNSSHLGISYAVFCLKKKYLLLFARCFFILI